MYEQYRYQSLTHSPVLACLHHPERGSPRICRDRSNLRYTDNTGVISNKGIINNIGVLNNTGVINNTGAGRGAHEYARISQDSGKTGL